MLRSKTTSRLGRKIHNEFSFQNSRIRNSSKSSLEKQQIVTVSSIIPITSIPNDMAYSTIHVCNQWSPWSPSVVLQQRNKQSWIRRPSYEGCKALQCSHYSITSPQRQSTPHKRHYSTHSNMEHEGDANDHTLNHDTSKNNQNSQQEGIVRENTRSLSGRAQTQGSPKENIQEINAQDSLSAYRKMTPIEHILHRSDSYVGTTQPSQQSQFVMHHSFERLQHIRDLKFTPAFYKIFDEILVNAVDNFHRKRTGTSNVWVSVCQDGWISIKNDGKNIPIKKHPVEKIWLPELCFGHLLTGSNFNDNEIKFTAGRNGYGTKLCNIFSIAFKIKVCDGKRIYHQEWRRNMYECDVPLVETLEEKCAPYIQVAFRPDFERLNIGSEILDKVDCDDEDPMIGLLRRRAFDVAACNSKLQVHWNDKLIPIHSFLDYVKLFYPQDLTNILYKKFHPNWEIAIAPSLNQYVEGGIDNSVPISFVNGIATSRGGSHTQYISQQISRAFIDHAENSKEIKELSLKLTPNQILSQITVFLNCQIENPTFDSQTKETLTNKLSQFANAGQLPASFLKQMIQEIDVLERIHGNALARQKSKDSREMKRLQNKRRLDIPKLDDANWAGTNRSKECTLILTEGDSAKALAVSGLSVLGRDKYGVFPLRGKLLNVRDMSRAKVDNNEELGYIRKILALEYGKDYSLESNREKLRYGRVMLMCDQDFDGSHIKGLFINFIQTFWPQLLKTDFLQAFQTPLIKVNPGTKKELSFYSMSEFNDWKSKNNFTGHIKYYKGLGTSTSSEAKLYFKELDKHRIQFTPSNNPVDDVNAINLAFGKETSSTQDRKEWLHQLKQDNALPQHNGELTFKDFVHHELIHFSQYSNERGIPNLVDGLKPAQRKILFSALKRNLKQEIKVAQLAGYVSEHASYHHGEASLHSTIVNMAQNYVGSNNIPLLYPSGQFGTRLNGGKDHASARYIFTRLNGLTRFIFHPDDDPILNYQKEDNTQIEPVFYVPILPMILVNGAEGLGTGWSTFIPCFNWRSILTYLEHRLDNLSVKASIPCHYEGFRGQINFRDGKYHTTGVIAPHPKNKYQFTIKELPIRKWTDDFKQIMHELMKRNDLPLNITSFSEQHTESKVHTTINISKQDLDKCLQEGKSSSDITDILTNQFKLRTSLTCSNMTLFTPTGHIQRFHTPEEIIEAYIPIRMQYYQKRKKYLIESIALEERELQNKVRFIELVMKNEIKITSQPLSRTLEQLEALNFYKKLKHDEKKSVEELIPEELGNVPIDLSVSHEDNNPNGDTKANANTNANTKENLSQQYKYLTSLPVYQFSVDHHKQLQSRLHQLMMKRRYIEDKDEKAMWKEDLEALKHEIERHGLLF